MSRVLPSALRNPVALQTQRLVHCPVFPIPNTGEGQTPDLRLYASNHSTQEGRADFTVYVAANDGQQIAVRRGFGVPAGGTAEAIEVLPEKLWGLSLRAEVLLSSSGVIPSLAVVRTFGADAGEDILVWMAPAQFR